MLQEIFQVQECIEEKLKLLVRVGYLKSHQLGGKVRDGDVFHYDPQYALEEVVLTHRIVFLSPT